MNGIRRAAYHFECLGEALLLRGSLVFCKVALGLAGEALVGISTTNGAVGLVEHFLGLFKEWSHFLDECVLIAVVFALALKGLDFLQQREHTWA